MGNYGKTNISTEQSPEGEKARFSGADENQVRAQRDQAPASERPQKVNGVSLLDLRLPKENRLRKPAEFRRVYEYGTRIEGRFMTVFIMPSKTSFQRLGITASKKAIGNAVQRNRAKRLLREAFRLSKADLADLSTDYDWVLNARRRLLTVKLEKPLEEFRLIVAKVRKIESDVKAGEKREATDAK